jgi:hypothetical protein
MQYLLDANVLIDAARDYYPFEMVPEFWAWLAYQGSVGNVKVPREMYEEVCEGKDPLAQWLREPATITALLLDEEVEPRLVAQAVAEGYAPDLTDSEVITVGRDPFLVAYAIAAGGQRCVVTTESSRPSAKRQNRRVPDVCSGFGVSCCNTFELTRRLGFSTSWKAPE